jgi:hypothetical protein
MADPADLSAPDPALSAAFEQLSKLEVDFARVELDARTFLDPNLTQLSQQDR